MYIYVAHSGKFDYKNELYRPLEESTLTKENRFFFPEKDKNNIINTKQLMKEEIDLVIAEISFPATGLGIELGRAEIYGIPILGVYKKGNKFSESIKFVTNNFLEYENAENLIDGIKRFIESRTFTTKK